MTTEELLKQILEEIKGFREDVNDLLSNEEDEGDYEEPDDSIFEKADE